MNLSSHYDQCLTFLNTQVKPPVRPAAKSGPGFRAVTLSRQTGTGGDAVAARLVASLNETGRKTERPWTVFDRNLVEKVLEDHQLPARLAKFFPEDRLTELQDIMDEVFGLRPASHTLVQQASETMLKLAALGNVVLVGRAGNLVTRKLPDVLHVRLVGSLEARARRLAESRGLPRKSALDLIEKEDAGRRRYVKKYFSADLRDAQFYHLVLNTDLVSIEETADLLARVVTQGF